MRPSVIRAGVVITTLATAGAVSLASSAQAAPPLGPDLVGEALTNAAVADVTGTVPSGVCVGWFIVTGGSGAGASLANQSYPGRLVGNVALHAGQTILLKTGTSGNGAQGGLGGFAPGGNGFTVGSFLGYGGGAASALLLDSVPIAVAAGGGGAANTQQGNLSGGAGGGGTNGAGQDGTDLGGGGVNNAFGGALGNSTAPNGQNSPTTLRDGTGSNPNGGGGGGGGWNGGMGGIYGASGGGGSNFGNLSAAGIHFSNNGSYGSVASGYAGIAYVACAIPSAISAVTVTPNGTFVEVSFPAAVDNGTPVTAYQYSLNGGTSWNTLTTSGSSTKTATVSDLSLATAYTVQVRPVYVTADIVANAVTSSPAGPGRGVTSYVTATSQSFTTLAQNIVEPQGTVLAQTGSPRPLAPLAGAFAAIIAGAALVLARRKNHGV
jgi:LPXTG-motif cell wall-anchored protein